MRRETGLSRKPMLISNALIALPDSLENGWLAVADGKIVEIGTGAPPDRPDLDFAGDFLLPGLVEIHTDNLDRHFTPRPSVIWPSPLGALVGHDAQMLAAGVTTVLDCFCAGEYDDAQKRRFVLDHGMQAIATARAAGVLKADHLVHLRCEVSDPGVLDMFEKHADNPLIRLISLMDHTPGQRQFLDETGFKPFNQPKHWTAEDQAAYVAEAKERGARLSRPQRSKVVARARALGLPLASHDDGSAEDVAESLNDGVRIAEFPTTRLAAEMSKAAGLSVIMGAPNVVRGGSLFGNVSAGEMARAGIADILSSDYQPTSLLDAAFKLSADMGLPSALALVTRNPAKALGLLDRGQIEKGYKADFLRVRLVDHHPIVLTAWRNGTRIH